ncbi:hypothetical protein DIPPA_19262 [Diplonema papillatum]|nr:hypothetical protein DIPPA_19262 [Diplonema papillatum]
MPKVTDAYLAGLTVVELKALAAELGVVVAGIQRKRELQARIVAEKDGDDGDSDEDEDDSDEAEGEAPARAALPANRKPVWRTPPRRPHPKPPARSTGCETCGCSTTRPIASGDRRQSGPEPRSGRRRSGSPRIRKLTPKIEDALVQEVIDDEIRALIKRKLDQRRAGRRKEGAVGELPVRHTGDGRGRRQGGRPAEEGDEEDPGQSRLG